jgi:hypothetical protein
VIHLECRGDEIGFGLLEDGNVGVTSVDRKGNMMVTVVFTPESWRAFLKNAGRLQGLGIHVPNRKVEVIPLDGQVD